MSTNHTTNYDLNQWEGTDKVLRTEFNADNAKIDAALKANADAIALKADAADVTVLWSELEETKQKLGPQLLINNVVTTPTSTLIADLTGIDWSQWASLRIAAVPILLDGYDFRSLLSLTSNTYNFLPDRRERFVLHLCSDFDSTNLIAGTFWPPIEGRNLISYPFPFSQLSNVQIETTGNHIGVGSTLRVWGLH